GCTCACLPWLRRWSLSQLEIGTNATSYQEGGASGERHIVAAVKTRGATTRMSKALTSRADRWPSRKLWYPCSSLTSPWRLLRTSVAATAVTLLTLSLTGGTAA